MKLHEYQAKQIFARHHIPVLSGELARTAADCERIAQRMRGPVALKAQVLAGGRGKVGGVRIAQTPREAHDLAVPMLKMQIEGLVVRQLLVEPAVTILQEMFLAVAIDRAQQRPVVLCSATGGVEIEVHAQLHPEQVTQVVVNPFIGLRAYQIAHLAGSIELPRDYWPQFGHIAEQLYEVFVEHDATLVEINPLAITPDGLLAVDGKLRIDDNALYRQVPLAALRDPESEHPLEREAVQEGLAYVPLEGEIGLLVNGAGLAMALMDSVAAAGGRAACFVDIDTSPDVEKLAAALRILAHDPNVKAVIVSLFGGMTRVDDIVWGLIAGLEQLPRPLPVVVRLAGENAAEGYRLLPGDVRRAETLMDAAEIAVMLVGGQTTA